jgi:NTP pyrophosphatase (non-canonical NTP hydrolase)
MNFETFMRNVKNWATERLIYRHSNARAQLLKGFSEMGELADADIKGDVAAKTDAVGDVLVCLVNYCEMSNLDISVCMEAAWNEIKDRKGHMVPGGAFIKDE